MIRRRSPPAVAAGAVLLGMAVAIPLWTLAAGATRPPGAGGPAPGGAATGSASAGGSGPSSTDPGSVHLAVPIIKQDLALDCEAAALEVALDVEGIEVPQDQITSSLPQDPRPPVLGAGGLPERWGDPYIAFVGDVNGFEASFTGYGVYYPPIVAVARRLGARTDGRLGWTVPEITAQLRAGNSVVVWLASDFKPHVPRHWRAWDGASVPYIIGEHSVPVIGYDPVQQTVTVVDVLYGIERTLSVQAFTAALTTFGGMGIGIY